MFVTVVVVIERLSLNFSVLTECYHVDSHMTLHFCNHFTVINYFYFPESESRTTHEGPAR